MCVNPTSTINVVLNVKPQWVKLPNLLLNYYCMDSFRRIWSTLGIQVYGDEYTNKQERISYARVLIQMDVTVPVPQIFKVQDHSWSVFDQEGWYDLILQYCNTCLKLGHDCSIKQSKLEATTQDKDRVQNKRFFYLKIV